MSGHSKWATIRRKKEINDLKKGKNFTKVLSQIVQITKEGGGDPKSNFLLKTVIERAKAINIPMETINKAIKKGLSNESSSDYDECLYEAYGPCGIAVIIKCLTDNKNRAISNLRSTIERNGGKMVDNGTLSWKFQKVGMITIKMSEIQDINLFEEKLIDIDGIVDYEYDTDLFFIYTDIKGLKSVSDILEKEDTIDNIKIAMIPKVKVEIDDIDEGEKVSKFLDAIESLEDVDDIYLNI